MLDEAKNGHAEPAARAWDARLARIERRLADIAEAGEQRIVILRDAVADFAAVELAKRDDEIVTLKKHIGDLERKLEQKVAVDQQVHEIAMRLEEKAARRDEAKRGAKGEKGERGVRGERGLPGVRGPEGKPAELGKFTWYVDAARYSVTPFIDGKPLAELNLRGLFERYLYETGGRS
jgi:hypothetical protein